MAEEPARPGVHAAVKQVRGRGMAQMDPHVGKACLIEGRRAPRSTSMASSRATTENGDGW